MEMSHEQVLSWLKPVQDPEIGMSLVDLGLVYGSNWKAPGVVAVVMTLTSPACPAAGWIVDQVKKRMQEHVDVGEALVEIVFDPKWDPKTMASDEAKDRLGIW